MIIMVSVWILLNLKSRGIQKTDQYSTVPFP